MLNRIALLLIGVACALAACENQAQDAGATLRNVSVVQAAQLIENNEAVIVLDVRSEREFVEGHIEGALHVSFHDDDFEAKLAALDKDATYVLMCHSGGRSGKTLRKLKRLGFLDVAHLKSGIAGWRRAGLPETTADP